MERCQFPDYFWQVTEHSKWTVYEPETEER